MSIRNFALKPIALAALLGLAGAANAAIVTYDSAAAFSAATTARVTDAYTDLVFGDTTATLTRTIGSFSYTAADYTDSTKTTTAPFFVAEADAGNPSLSTNSATDYISFSSFTGKTVTAIGGNFFGTDFDQNLVAGTDGGALVLTIVDGTGSHDLLFANITSTSSFFGVTSTSAITSLSLHGATGLAYPTVDNLIFAAAVPEPETYALMLAGLGVVAWLGRRNKRSA